MGTSRTRASTGRCRPSLPPALAVLLDALAAGTRRPGRFGQADVPFKNAGQLLPVLGDALGRLVTRRALLRYLSALRRRLNASTSGRRLTIQRDRWLGWRVVPRASGARGDFARQARGSGHRRRSHHRRATAVSIQVPALI